jgi:hypothetical protein
VAGEIAFAGDDAVQRAQVLATLDRMIDALAMTAG